MNSKYKKIITIGFICFFGLVILAIPRAHAHADFLGIGDTLSSGWDWIKGKVGDAANGIVGAAFLPFQIAIMGFLIGTQILFGLLLYLFSSASVYFIERGVAILELPAVSAGFKSTLGITNLIFVLAIIVIAFATIFRWESYSAKKMLPKLVIAALLVNFSFLIAGLLLDVSNVFTNYFIARIKGGSLSGLNAIGGSLGLNDMSKLQASFTDIITPSTLTTFINMITQELFFVLMTFVAMVVMLAVSIMALVRNLWVVMLIVLMPIVWGLWVLPKFEHYWKEWWTNFLNWGVIYLPTVTFFLVLAVNTADGVISPIKIDDPKALGFLATFADQTIRFMLVTGLMIAGLKVAKKMGAVGAGLGLALATRGGIGVAKGITKLSVGAATGATGGLIGGATGAFGKVGGSRWSSVWRGAKAGASMGASAPTAAVNAAKGRLRGAADTLSSGAAALSSIPGMEAVALALRGSSSASGAIEENKKKADMLSRAARRELALASLTQADEKAAGAFDSVVSNHEIGDLTKDLVNGKLVDVSPQERERRLKGFADKIARLNPGIPRDKIKSLRDAAESHPFDSQYLTGEKPADVIKRAKPASVEQWDEHTYVEARALTEKDANGNDIPVMPPNLHNAYARASGENYARVESGAKLALEPAVAAHLANMDKEITRLANATNPEDINRRNKLAEERSEIANLGKAGIIDAVRIGVRSGIMKMKLSSTENRNFTIGDNLTRVIGGSTEKSHADHTNAKGVVENFKEFWKKNESGGFFGGAKGGSSGGSSHAPAPSKGGGGHAPTKH